LNGTKGFSKKYPKLMRDQQTGHAKEISPFGTAGFLLLDSALDPIYVNDEAVRILAYPDSRFDEQRLKKVLASVIQSACSKTRGALRTAAAPRIQSGRRQYTCRLFSVSPISGSRQRPALALLIERNAVSMNLLGMAEEFKLTQREYEAVQHLALGLTSKEISARMGISPNTVKTFLKLVMIKTGVNTRSGIIGKLLKSA
jgi:DNA-binding CsgD family transcriptional regulator